MINVLEKFFANALSKVEPFTEEKNTNNGKSVIPILLAVILTEILLLLIGKHLWNNYLVNAVTIVKPIDSVFQLFAIGILIRLLLG
jgi:hypothetical protein|tara:strand:- start:1151 stop:1408 length:258 start_codon:yes stop_codon:yes gene_type:complete